MVAGSKASSCSSWPWRAAAARRHGLVEQPNFVLVRFELRSLQFLLVIVFAVVFVGSYLLLSLFTARHPLCVLL
jgi:hypothetical protein